MFVLNVNQPLIFFLVNSNSLDTQSRELAVNKSDDSIRGLSFQQVINDIKSWRRSKSLYDKSLKDKLAYDPAAKLYKRLLSSESDQEDGHSSDCDKSDSELFFL
ncbi:hypothetical protein GJ496_007108 [Pomphorhynchus laevis]|nr:hypothetical protein GJ496_007108 [Pomphorhynchus laevis]